MDISLDPLQNKPTPQKIGSSLISLPLALVVLVLVLLLLLLLAAAAAALP